MDKSQISLCLQNVAAVWSEKSDLLSEIDSKFGDGDHGITIKKIAKLIDETAKAWGEEDIYTFFDELGDGIMAINGGSAGPLYGTFIQGMGSAFEGAHEIDEQGAKQMLEGAVEAMGDVTKAKIGDKTMMDALLPAAEAGSSATGGVKAVFEAAMMAAEKGAKDSEGYVSKYGRARSYKEQTIGTPDAGAMSMALFFKGFAEGIK